MLSLTRHRAALRKLEKARDGKRNVVGASLFNLSSNSTSSPLQNSCVETISDECPNLAASLTRLSTTTGGPPALGCMYGVTCNICMTGRTGQFLGLMSSEQCPT